MDFEIAYTIFMPDYYWIISMSAYNLKRQSRYCNQNAMQI